MGLTVLREKSIYSLKEDCLGYIIRDSETGKYLRENSFDSSEDMTSYKSQVWWADALDDACLFEDNEDVEYILTDLRTDFDLEDSDRFEVHAVYPDDIYVDKYPVTFSKRTYWL